MEKCFKISGRVQRVGFRYWVIKTAVRIGGISGYVCNLHNGDVLVYASGTADVLNLLYLELYKGPLFARVDTVQEAPECRLFFPQIENGVFKKISI